VRVRLALKPVNQTTDVWIVETDQGERVGLFFSRADAERAAANRT
jgi:hypothetical protein